METKLFGDKKITIRKATRHDLKNIKKFQDFINSLIEEDAKILMNNKLTLKEEREFLKMTTERMKNKTKIYLIAECEDKIVGATDIELERWRKNHIGGFGITISQGYRGMGLGKYLISEVIKLAEKELKPKPKIIQLEVFANNKPAIALYRKMGFKQVAKLPKQIHYKEKFIDALVMLKYL